MTLHLEILGYISHLFNELMYFRRICDFRGDSLILRLLWKNISVGNTVKIYRSCRKDIQRVYFIDGTCNIELNFLVEEGICTEDAKCNLKGDIEILSY